MVQGAVLMKSGLVSINTARQNILKIAVSVNTARQVNITHSKTIVNAARPMSYLSKTAHSTVKRHINNKKTFKNSNINQRVNTIRGKNVNTARTKAVVNVVQRNNVNAVKALACWVWKPKTKVLDHGNPQIALQDKGVIDNGCSRYMTGNMSYLTDYEEIDGGYVAFGGNPKGEKNTRKCTIKTARTPQQNGVDERRNMTLIEAARTMLADSKLPTTFWAEAVNTACYVQNRVLVVKPHNKTPYECFQGRTPTLSFIRPFGCPVTILNTIDHLGKFDGKADEGFFVRYSLNSKAFRVFNSRTRIMEENLHFRFSESTPNVVESGPDWLFDIDALTRTMNYEPIVADPKSSQDDGSKPSSDDGKKVDEDLRKDSKCNDQEKEVNVNSTNNVNAASTNEVNDVGAKTSIKLPVDPNILALEDISIFDFTRDDEDDSVEADINNLNTTIQVSPNQTTRIHKDHPLDQVIGDLQSATQTRNMSKNLKEHGRTIKANSCIKGSKLDKGYTERASTIQAETRVWTLSGFTRWKKIEEEVYVCQPPGFEDQDFPHRVYKVEKALYGLHQALRAWYETLSTYLLDNEFQRGKFEKTLFIKRYKGDILLVQVYADDIIFGSTKKELYNAFEKLMHEKFHMNGEEVDVHMYRLMIGSLMYLTSSRPDIMFAVCAYARYQVNPKVSYLYAVKRIFRYLKGQSKLGFWYAKDSPFDLVAYADSDYAGASFDRKSTTGGCQFLRSRLISWRCKKQIMVANSIEAEYVAASSCCG
ncbi:putative ribonuclease H-like domain-containing protein [Tanacetum coccineum]